ncbi:MAG: hypothetical protein Q4A24_05945 [Akkermansia sp.]|nr:hypothetical protein [Akkermansia sp.]
MKTCLGGVLLLLAVIFVVVTVAYHTSVNSTLTFEPKDAGADYINTQRSYRPPRVATPKPRAAAKPQFCDDEEAEAVGEPAHSTP